jgi:hypothetical protein
MKTTIDDDRAVSRDSRGLDGRPSHVRSTAVAAGAIADDSRAAKTQ